MGQPRIGYAAMLEQFAPRDLVDWSIAAEAAGFDGIMAADHVQPWIPHQGNAAFVWSFMTAAAERTQGDVGPGRDVPVVPHAPGDRRAGRGDHGGHVPRPLLARARVRRGAQRAHRGAVLAGGRPSGSPACSRRSRSSASSSAARTSSTSGEFYRMETMRLWTMPETPPPIYVATAGPITAKKTGRLCDGLITVGAPDEKIDDDLRALRQGGREAGKDPDPPVPDPAAPPLLGARRSREAEQNAWSSGPTAA